MIRGAIDQINQQIKALEQEKLDIQKSCKHQVQREVDYMWRPGATVKVEMCCVCDKIISEVQSNSPIEFTTTSSDDYDGSILGHNWKEDEVSDWNGKPIGGFNDDW